MKNKKEGLQFNKRGLSTIVVTLILVVLSLVAVGVVWAVISNLLKTGEQQSSSSFGQLFISLTLQNVNLKTNGDVDVTVQRNSGTGDLKAINFIVSDGTNSQVIKKSTTLQELGTNTFTLSTSDLGNVGFVKEISISPVVNTNGKETAGNVVDKKIYATADAIKNMGAVSWWRLNGNANDELGNNNGNVVGNVIFSAGKSGQAASFDGTTSNYIRADSVNNLPLGSSPRTMLAWIKPAGYPDPSYTGVFAYGTMGCYGKGSLLSMQNSGRLSMAFWCNDAYQAGTTATLNQWNQIAFTYDGGTTIKFYINGALADTESLSYGQPAATLNGPLRIGCTDDPGRCFNGQIEDAMIFNRELTANQIAGLYNTDLSK
ncbi:Concanavalin A-like lectin/glucanases superfamily protein [uncultured archaeon]|nr:Concanavalin A-like lectin/glucanases superfamily protein [uncultured archaeon]